MKYQDGIEEINKINSAIKTLTNMLGEGSGIDKNYFYFQLVRKNSGDTEAKIITDGHWNIGILHVKGVYGYYGNSHCNDVIDAYILELMEKALNKMEKTLTHEMLNILWKRKKEIAESIKEDAKMVLENLKEEK